MNTKNKIITEALNLFSKKGFHSVSVRDIASAVGIKASSIYNHFENKQAIFDTIISNGTNSICDFLNKINSTNEIEEYLIQNQLEISNENLFDAIFKLQEFCLTDDFVVKFRNLLQIESFNNEKISQLFNRLFIENIIEKGSNFFSILINLEMIKDVDPNILSLQFYSPFILFFCKKDNYSNEILFLKNHVTEFRKIYEL